MSGAAAVWPGPRSSAVKSAMAFVSTVLLAGNFHSNIDDLGDSGAKPFVALSS